MEEDRYEPQMPGMNVFTCPTCVYRNALYILKQDAVRCVDMEDGDAKEAEEQHIAEATSDLLDYGLTIADNTCRANAEAVRSLLN